MTKATAEFAEHAENPAHRMRIGPAEFAEKSFQKRFNTKDTKKHR